MQRSRKARLSRRAVLYGLAASGLTLQRPWAASADTKPDESIAAIGFDGATILMSQGQFWRRDDKAGTWVAASAQNTAAIAALATHSARPGLVLAALRTGGVIRSDDGGSTWRKTGSGLPKKAAAALTIASDDPKTVYVAVRDDGLWRSSDDGATWEFVMDCPFQDHRARDVLTLASVNIKSGMGGVWVYAGTELGLTRVPDCFCRWQGVDDPDAMAALASGKQPTPAQPLPANHALMSIASAPLRPQTMFAGLTSGIWKSTDAGVRWTKIGDAPARHLAVNPLDPDHVIAATETSIQSSRDGGNTWSALATA